MFNILDKYIISKQDSLSHLKDQKNYVLWSNVVSKTGSSHMKITQSLKKKGAAVDFFDYPGVKHALQETPSEIE